MKYALITLAIAVLELATVGGVAAFLSYVFRNQASWQ